MAPGERFADYILFEQLSSTTFGELYRAGLTVGGAVDRHVLLQLFNGSCLDRRAFWMLVSDRQHLSDTLSDPHLGECLAFDRVEDVPFAAYSYAPSRSLNVFFTAARDRKLPVPLDQALFIIDRAALALTAAYGVGHRGRPVLHGFLVPDLMQLSGEGEIRVFGIEAAPGLRNQLSNHPAFVSFLAPEVRAGEPPAETDDVYSLGSLLFQLVCGENLPNQTSLSVPEILENSRLAGTGDPLPPVISTLLESSLAPRAERIPNVVTWQQTLGRIILEGEHNPTTFNLSFLMHTLFRQELEQELCALEQERSLRSQESSARQIPAPSAPTSDPEAIAADLLTSLVTRATDRSPFLSGFLLSFVTALVLVCGYFLFLRSSSASAAEEAQTVLVTASDTPFTSSRQLDPVGALRLSDGAAEPMPLVAPSTPPEPTPQAPSEDQLLEYLRSFDRPDTRSLDDEETPSRAESQEPASETVQEREPLGPDSVDLITESPEAQEPTVPVPSSLAASIDTSPAETENELVAAILPTVDPERDVPLDISQTPPEPIEPDGIARDLNDLGSTESEPTAASGGLELPSTQAGTEDSEAPSTRVLQDAAVLVPPRLETPPRPHYPAAARRLRRAATVSVRVLIDPTGKVREAEIDGPRTGLGFDGAAVSAAKRSRWEPATRNGEPVEAWAVLTIEFQP